MAPATASLLPDSGCRAGVGRKVPVGSLMYSGHSTASSCNVKSTQGRACRRGRRDGLYCWAAPKATSRPPGMYTHLLRMKYQETKYQCDNFTIERPHDYTSVFIYTGVGMRCVCARSHTHRLHAYVKSTSHSPSPLHRSKRTPVSPPLSRFLNLPVTHAAAPRQTTSVTSMTRDMHETSILMPRPGRQASCRDPTHLSQHSPLERPVPINLSPLTIRPVLLCSPYTSAPAPRSARNYYTHIA